MGGGSLFKNHSSLVLNKKKYSHKINVDRLDNVLLKKKIKSISVIKIDIEGSEKFAILGMKNILKKHSPILMIEIDNKLNSSTNLEELLKNYGYVHSYEIKKKFSHPISFFFNYYKLEKINKIQKKYYSVIIFSKYKL